jgi:hypothetical protein
VLSRWIPGRAARHRKRTVLRLVAQRLGQVGVKFIARHDVVVGPGGCGVALLDSDHCPDARHLDLGFTMKFQDPESWVIDCVEAPGETDEESWRNAIDVWATTTGMAVIEGMAMDGRYATHVHGDSPDGVPGWHAVVGGITGWGHDDPDPVAQWLAGSDWLPLIAPVLDEDLHRARNNGIKVLLGGPAGDEIASVRVNNRDHVAASEVLAGLDWPRSLAFARTFVLLLHRESAAA